VISVGSMLLMALAEPTNNGPGFLVNMAGAVPAGSVAVATVDQLQLLTSDGEDVFAVDSWRDRRIIHVPLDGVPCELVRAEDFVVDIRVVGDQLLWLEKEEADRDAFTTVDTRTSALRAVDLPASAREEE